METSANGYWFSEIDKMLKSFLKIKCYLTRHENLEGVIILKYDSWNVEKLFSFTVSCKILTLTLNKSIV